MYSTDGTQVTLYLDGVGVPVTQSQRKLTKEIAQMAHDFYEVVFWAKDPDDNDIVTRATWEIGQSAGIKGLYKGEIPATGYMYPPNHHDNVSSNYGAVSLFAGRKVDKTLLAAGTMTHVDGRSDFPFWPTISSSTKSVTFTVDTIITNLDLDTVYDSDTSFVTASGVYPYDIPSTTNTKANNMAEKVSLGGVLYPYYKLPNSSSVAAKYRFFVTSYQYGLEYIRVIYNDSIKREVIKREPRILSGGQYYYIQAAKIDTGTTVDFDPSFNHLEDNGGSAHFVFLSAYNYGIRLIFNTSNSQGGIFSVTFRIPVFNLTRLPSGNDGIVWYIQPGFGRDLFSLDNGVDAGGCILMGYNADSPGDMIEIFTDGMP